MCFLPSGPPPGLPEKTKPEKVETVMDKRKDMFVVIQSETERFKELILLLKNNSTRKPALLIVERTRTHPVLLSALLCLEGLPASTRNVRSAPGPESIRIICTDELKMNKITAQLIVNVDMVSAFDQIGERMKFLEKNGEYLLCSHSHLI